MKNVSIQRLESTDEPIARQISGEFLGQSAVPAAHLTHMLADERNIVIAALRGESPVGFLVAHHFPSLSGERLVYLYEIEVREVDRRSGIATRMVSALKNICQTQGVTRIWVGSSLSNTAACSLWAATGARRVSDQYVEFIYDFDAQQGVGADRTRLPRSSAPETRYAFHSAQSKGENIMLKINYLAVIVAAVAAFMVGPLWYSPLLFGDVWMTLRGMDPGAMADMTPPLGVLIAEFVRVLVVAYVLARFVVLTGVVDWKGAVQLGLWVWIGFQAMLLVGSVLHENYPWELFAIHAGDALVKTLLMTVIIGVWRHRASSVKEGV